MKLILQDILYVWALLTGCMVTGLVINEFHTSPLPWIYNPPELRLQQSLETLNPGGLLPIALEGDVTREEMKTLSIGKSALILDARPAIFYQHSHIPSAISLPRDNFENRYKALKSLLELYKSKLIVVYCAESECRDSQTVGEALTRLGFRHVRLYRLGWLDWAKAGLPEEKE